MPDRAARLARLGTRLVSALAGLLMLALLAFGGFALWQDAALRRGAVVGAELLQYKPAAPAADNPTPRCAGRDEHGLRQPRRLR